MPDMSTVGELAAMDGVTRHMDEYGPWWAREEGSADG